MRMAILTKLFSQAWFSWLLNKRHLQKYCPLSWYS
jgi:hypothetical protein